MLLIVRSLKYCNIYTDHKEGEQLEDRRNVGENSCNSEDGTDQTGTILDVFDDDDILLDIVGTVYHLVIYMQSNKIHKVF